MKQTTIKAVEQIIRNIHSLEHNENSCYQTISLKH